MSDASGGGGVLVSVLFDTLAPLLTLTLSVSTTLMLSMLLLRVRLNGSGFVYAGSPDDSGFDSGR